MRGRFVRMMLFCMILGQGLDLEAALQVSGEVSYTTFHDKPEAGERQTTLAFAATFDGCLWRIRTSQLGTNASRWSNSPYVYMEEANSFDSLFVTRVFKTPTDLPKGSTFISNSVTVTAGAIPYMDGEQFTAAIWFPYAADCALAGITNGQVRNFFTMVSSSEKTYPCSLKYLSNSSPPVIEKLEISSDGTFLRGRINGPTARARYKPPYDSGFVECAFTVLEYTNAGTLKLPLRSQIKHFMTKNDARDNKDTLLSAQVDIVAKSVVVTNLFLEPPENVPNPSEIYDKRVSTGGDEPFSYLSKGLIYGTNSPEFKAKRRQFEMMHPGQGKS